MNSIDASKVSIDILNISLSLGQLQGKVEEKEYTQLCKDLHESCQDVDTYQLKSTIEVLKGMKKSLGEIYNDITTVQTNCSNITDSNIRIIFDKQIKHLHEQRGALRSKLRELYQIVYAHKHLRKTLSEAQELVSRKALSKADILEIDNKSKELKERTDSIFKGKSSCKEHFSKSHNCEFALIRKQINSLRSNLPLRSEKILKDVTTRIEILLEALNNLSKDVNNAKLRKSIQLNFALLPYDLRMKFLELAGTLPENYSEHADALSQIKLKNNEFEEETRIFELLRRDGLSEARELRADENRKQLARMESTLKELKGEQSFSEFPITLFDNPEKAMKDMIETLNYFPDYCETKESDSLERSTSRKILNYVTKYNNIDVDIDDSVSSLGNGKPSSKKSKKRNHSLSMPRNSISSFKNKQSLSAEKLQIKLIENRLEVATSEIKVNPIVVAPEEIPTETKPVDSKIELEVTAAEIQSPLVLQEPLSPPTRDEILKSISERGIHSLDVLKNEVEQIDGKTHLTDEEKESIAKALIESAEKNGVAVDGPNRIYYWVWFIANKSDPRGTHGNNYGKIHAPKDIKRLLQAIECTNTGKFCDLH